MTQKDNKTLIPSNDLNFLCICELNIDFTFLLAEKHLIMKSIEVFFSDLFMIQVSGVQSIPVLNRVNKTNAIKQTLKQQISNH